MTTTLEQTASDLAYEAELKQGIGEEVPDAVVVASKAGVILYVNDEALIMFGYVREQLLGQTVEVLLPKDVSEIHAGKHRPGFNQDPRPRSMSTRPDLKAIDSEGHTFPVNVELRPKPTTRGTVTFAYVRRRLV